MQVNIESMGARRFQAGRGLGLNPKPKLTTPLGRCLPMLHLSTLGTSIDVTAFSVLLIEWRSDRNIGVSFWGRGREGGLHFVQNIAADLWNGSGRQC